MIRHRKKALIAGLALAAVATTAAADISLYGREDFRGRSITAQDSIQNLESSGFNDRASSIVVRGGPWLVCSDAYYRGHCVTLRPGDYPSLASMGLNDSVSSARELRGDRYGDRSYRHDRDPQVTLYEGPNYSGRSLTIDGNSIRNLESSGFNDRASSMRVEGAAWTLCSDAYFQGDCRTFNPGDYPYLPEELSNRVSSARRDFGPEPHAFGQRY